MLRLVQTASILQADPAEIGRAVSLLLEPGQVTEVRALEVSTPSYRRPHTVSGYFDDRERLIAAALAVAEYAKGVYIVPNAINPALLARAANRLRPVNREPLTGDSDVIARRWLLIDADPRRPAGISSSEAEHHAAIERVCLIRDCLRAEGWPEPILADSGNGAHLLYRIELPTDDGGLVKRTLEGLAFRFDDEAVLIDQTVANPARIWKLYGTIARKGDSTSDRPHRLGQILEAPEPEHLAPVPRERLEALAAGVPQVPESRAAGRPTPADRPAQAGRPAQEGFDLETWIERHGMAVRGPLPWKHGHRWIFDVCPWNEDHRNQSAYIVRFDNGAIAAGCHHNGCADNTWRTLRALYEETEGSTHRRTRAIVTVAPEWVLDTADEPDDGPQIPTRAVRHDPRPKINAGELDLPKITAAAWDALRGANDPPSLFRQGGTIVRLEQGDEGEPITRDMTADRMRHALARVACWTRVPRDGDVTRRTVTLPPPHVVRDVLATADPPLPVLARIVEAPTFAADGTLELEPDYHAASRTFFAPDPGLTIPPLPECPTADDLARARTLLCEDLLGDFPFVGPSERAHAVALLLLPFARELIAGPTPLHLVEKPIPGTGANLLVDMLTYPILGRSIAAMTEGRDEDEWRKRITAKLRSGAPLVLIDNLRHRLDSAAVAAAITASRWEDRLLGASEIIWLPVRCAWVATGNNPGLSNEITRRTVRVRLDAQVDQPWRGLNSVTRICASGPATSVAN